MPRVKRRGHVQKFRTEFEARVWRILESLREQWQRNPEGPLVAPKSIAGILAESRFCREVRDSGKPAPKEFKYEKIG